MIVTEEDLHQWASLYEKRASQCEIRGAKETAQFFWGKASAYRFLIQAIKYKTYY